MAIASRAGASKVTAVTTPLADFSPSSSSQAVIPIPQLTTNQYQQLLSLLNIDGQPSAANFTGASHLFALNLSLLSHATENANAKPASNQWFDKFYNALKAAGFKQSIDDYSLFICSNGHHFIAVLVYVDDVIVTDNDNHSINRLKSYLDTKFHIKDLGWLKYFLGIEVPCSAKGIFLSQGKYILDILKETGFLDPNYTCAQPIHVDTLQVQLDVAQRVLRYLKATPEHGILLPLASDLKITTYSDSNRASCPMTRRSTTEYITFLGTSPISWRSKKQNTVARSLTEAEYRSMATSSCELTWLKFLLDDLGVPHSRLMHIHCDNQAALHIAANPVFNEHTKYIELDCHLIW
ncbi:uncharacterized protein LOC110007851 [Amborella trichopoda]|uniref:uncharacterized protein LOC110007851 n=1 Tax=Amborella trichopoda TaxID=13333 RepID=UPI0009BD24A6|nr:uncharacterized protein LOC110007851 [Amborella trichopoda]|eukprot:XP_020527251.1 uncharacterized protein LOC110007851 [Amborella trichopoda]